MISSKIKRLRIKLELLDKEGCNSLLIDMIDLLQRSSVRLENEYDKLDIIKELKFNYKEELQNLTPKDSKQQNLFDNDSTS